MPLALREWSLRNGVANPIAVFLAAPGAKVPGPGREPLRDAQGIYYMFTYIGKYLDAVLFLFLSFFLSSRQIF